MYQVIIKNTINNNTSYSDVSFENINQAKRYIKQNSYLYPGFELDIIPSVLSSEPKQVSLFSDLLEIQVGMKCDLTMQLAHYWESYNRNLLIISKSEVLTTVDLTPWFNHIKPHCTLKDIAGAIRCADRDFLLNNNLIKK